MSSLVKELEDEINADFLDIFSVKALAKSIKMVR
jgi:hypothetical protein